MATFADLRELSSELALSGMQRLRGLVHELLPLPAMAPRHHRGAHRQLADVLAQRGGGEDDGYNFDYGAIGGGYGGGYLYGIVDDDFDGVDGVKAEPEEPYWDWPEQIDPYGEAMPPIDARGEPSSSPLTLASLAPPGGRSARRGASDSGTEPSSGSGDAEGSGAAEPGSGSGSGSSGGSGAESDASGAAMGDGVGTGSGDDGSGTSSDTPQHPNMTVLQPPAVELPSASCPPATTQPCPPSRDRESGMESRLKWPWEEYHHKARAATRQSRDCP